MHFRFGLVCTLLMFGEWQLVEESQDFACHVLPSRFFVVHDPGRCCEHNVPKLTGWQQLHDPFLHVTELDVESWRDDTGLVQSTWAQSQ